MTPTVISIIMMSVLCFVLVLLPPSAQKNNDCNFDQLDLNFQVVIMVLPGQ